MFNIMANITYTKNHRQIIKNLVICMPCKATQKNVFKLSCCQQFVYLNCLIIDSLKHEIEQ